MAIEQQQQAASGRVREGSQVIENGWGAAAHLIRSSGLNDKRPAGVKSGGSGVLAAVGVLPDEWDDLRARDEVVDPLLEAPNADGQLLQPLVQIWGSIVT
jgi:hypothetical protein